MNRPIARSVVGRLCQTPLPCILLLLLLLARCTPCHAGGELHGNATFSGSVDFSGITNKTTVLSDLGASNATNLVSGTLNDARLSSDVLLSTGTYSNPSWLTLTFSALSSKPTTLGGYGITDAQPLATPLTDLAGNVTSTLNFSNVTATFGSLSSSPLNASNLSSGTVPNGRFPATYPAGSGVNLTSLTTTNLADPGSNSTVALGHVTFSLNGLTFANSNSMALGNMGHTIGHADAVETGLESNEIGITGSNANENVFWVRNTSTAGFSAITARDQDGREVAVFGHGNSADSVSMFTNTNYIENWSGHLASPIAPTRFLVASDGNYGTFGSGFRFYQRLSFEPDGTPVFWKLIPWAGGSEQRRALDISDTFVSGLVSGVSKTFQGTLLTIGSNGSVSDAEPTGYQAELRAGPDDNAAIVLRSAENCDVTAGGNCTDFHIFGGPRLFGGANYGYRFYTGIRDSGQTLQFQVATDYVASYLPLYLAPGSAPTAISGAIYPNSSDHHLYYYDGTAWKPLDDTAAGKSAWVDATNGSDTTGTLGLRSRPFATIGAAVTAASSGYLVHVLPGSYTEHNIGKNGVDLDFDAGASVSYSGSSSAIFDDTSSGANGAIVVRVTGHGQFTSSGSSHGQAVLWVTNSGSVVTLSADSLASGGLIVNQSGGALDVTCPSLTTTVTSGTAVEIFAGTARFHRATITGPCTGGSTGLFYVTATGAVTLDHCALVDTDSTSSATATALWADGGTVTLWGSVLVSGSGASYGIYGAGIVNSYCASMANKAKYSGVTDNTASLVVNSSVTAP